MTYVGSFQKRFSSLSPIGTGWIAYVRDPGRLLADVSEQVQDPFTRFQAFVFSALFACFFLAMYLTLVALTHFQQEVREGGGEVSGDSTRLDPATPPLHGL